MSSPRGSARISPTAHYTGQTWVANGLSHPALATAAGRVFHAAMRPVNAALAAAGQPNLEGMLLARHRLIDALLEEAIVSGEVGQVLEIACGLSPRGHRFTARHGHALGYVEADLPAMAARKREALGRIGETRPRHRVVEIDATAGSGPTSLDAIAATLDPALGMAIVTEGLLNYFPRDAVLGMWARFARVLARFPRGRYFADLHVLDATGETARLFASALGVLVRGRVHFHFADAAAAEVELKRAGFGAAALRRPEAHTDLTGPVDAPSARLVRIVDATSRS